MNLATLPFWSKCCAGTFRPFMQLGRSVSVAYQDGGEVEHPMGPLGMPWGPRQFDRCPCAVLVMIAVFVHEHPGVAF